MDDPIRTFENLLQNFGQLQQDFRQAQDELRRAQSDIRTLQTDTQTFKRILQKDSTNLLSLMYITAYPVGIPVTATELSSGAIHATGGGTTTTSSEFDVTQKSKDAAGNISIPHAFYLVSAFAPALTGGPAPGPRLVVYQGTPIILNDISVYLTRTASGTPTKVFTTISIYNAGAATDVYVKVLKLLGAR